jgi:hypothetical protein
MLTDIAVCTALENTTVETVMCRPYVEEEGGDR